MALKINIKFEGKLTCASLLVLPKMTSVIWQIFTLGHSKVLKLRLLWDPPIQSIKCMNLKFTEELSAMAMKNDAKCEEELTCRFKIDVRNLLNFDQSTQSLKNLHFNGLLLSKVYNLWA